MSEKPQPPKVAYALTTGFVGIGDGKDVQLERGQEWNLEDPYQLAVVKKIKHHFSPTKPED